jgi:hypothetical protein
MKNSTGVLFVFLVSAHLCFSQNSFFGWMNGGRQLSQDIEKQTAKSNISPLETNSLENVNFSTSQKQSDQPISENNPNFSKASLLAINNALLNTNISNGKTNPYKIFVHSYRMLFLFFRSVAGGNLSSINSSILHQNQTILSNILGSEVAEIITTM